MDFSTRTIEGYGKYDVSIVQNACDRLVLDTRKLEVMKADILTNTAPENTPFELIEDTDNPILGSALVINLGKRYDTDQTVR